MTLDEWLAAMPPIENAPAPASDAMYLLKGWHVETVAARQRERERADELRRRMKAKAEAERQRKAQRKHWWRFGR